MGYALRNYLAGLVSVLIVLVSAGCRGPRWPTPKPPPAMTADAQTVLTQEVLLEDFVGDWRRLDGGVDDILTIRADLSVSRQMLPADWIGEGYNGRLVVEANHFHLLVDETYAQGGPATPVAPRVVVGSWIPVRWGQQRLLILDTDLPQFCAHPDMGYCKPGRYGALHIVEGSEDSCQYWIRSGPRVSQLPEEVPVRADGTPVCR